MWKDLTISEKADLMRIYIANGISDLDTMVAHYNSRGGSKDSPKDPPTRTSHTAQKVTKTPTTPVPPAVQPVYVQDATSYYRPPISFDIEQAKQQYEKGTKRAVTQTHNTSDEPVYYNGQLPVFEVKAEHPLFTEYPEYRNKRNNPNIRAHRDELYKMRKERDKQGLEYLKRTGEVVSVLPLGKASTAASALLTAGYLAADKPHEAGIEAISTLFGIGSEPVPAAMKTFAKRGFKPVREVIDSYKHYSLKGPLPDTFSEAMRNFMINRNKVRTGETVQEVLENAVDRFNREQKGINFYGLLPHDSKGVPYLNEPLQYVKNNKFPHNLKGALNGYVPSYSPNKTLIYPKVQMTMNPYKLEQDFDTYWAYANRTGEIYLNPITWFMDSRKFNPILGHEVQHTVQRNFPPQYQLDIPYGTYFKNNRKNPLTGQIFTPLESGPTPWVRSVDEYDAEIINYKLSNGIPLSTDFKDLPPDRKQHMAKWLGKRFKQSPAAILNMNQKGSANLGLFTEGGSLNHNDTTKNNEGNKKSYYQNPLF